MQSFTIRDKKYRTNVHVYVCKSFAKFCKYINEAYNEDLSEYSNSGALFVEVNEQPIIWIPIINHKPFYYSIYIHELFHASIWIGRTIGLGDINESNEEAYAYILEELSCDFFKKLTKFNI